LDFNQIQMEYYQVVSRVAMSYENIPERARELEQEIWVAVWKSLAKFRGDASVKTWLYRVAHNIAISHATREVKRGKYVSLDNLIQAEGTDSGSGDVLLAAGNYHDPLKAIEAKSELERIKETIAQFQPIDRQMFLLYLEGCKQTEIAEITGLSETNISSKVLRIKNILKKIR